jgi:protein-S-isoprenylcysteine O-methyltransferase Ste14
VWAGVAGQPAKAALLAITLAAWLVIELRQGRRRRPEGKEDDRGSRSVLRACQVTGWVVALTASVLPIASIPGGLTLFAAGLLATWGGIGLRWWSFASLGRYFTFAVTTAPDQPLIETGPYRLMRHPGYAGAVLALAGVGMMYANWIGLAGIVLVPLAGYINRIHVEERALEDALGDRWRSYASMRKRMVPFVW